MSNQTSSLDGSLQGQTIDNTLGAVFIGIVGATFLFGITTLQVSVLWTLDTVHLVLIVHATYHYAVKGFGDASNMAFIVWSVKLQVTINVPSIAVFPLCCKLIYLSSLYAYRVWILGGYHHGVLGYVVAGVVIGGFGIGAAVAYKMIFSYTIQMFEELHAISWTIYLSLATSTAIDFTIASTMCYYLHKSRGSESQLNSRISTVMQYSLSSGLFTRNVDGQASSGVKPGIEFRVQMSTFTDEDAQWQHETSSNSPHSPASESQSTYVSWDLSLSTELRTKFKELNMAWRCRIGASFKYSAEKC
ncbi:hypothetical protein F5876DRAFT_66063 [Lentinula aff. lateritia]|uniref:Uncharacterized protein n=1 Tax=Lentinula aff. lateritia TaxID=2804960 RepID=A0ACC1TZP0_9AGAR|nr:hypothetical protein F5876DRAFT_66063 [Lentinula aff. lateritia]